MERKINVQVKPYGDDAWRDETLNTFHEWFDDYVELYDTPERKLKAQYKRFFDAWFGQCCPGHREGLSELDEPCCYCDFGPLPTQDLANLQLRGDPCACCATNHDLIVQKQKYQNGLQRGNAPV